VQAERAELAAVPATPHADLVAERAILGSVLLDNATLATVEALCAPRDMYHPGHAAALEGMFALARTGVGVDVVTLGAELKRRKRLESCGGHAYIMDLSDYAIANVYLERHCRIVADHAAARRVLAAAAEVTALGADGRLGARGLIEQGTKRFADAAVVREARPAVPIGTAVREAFDRIERALREGVATTGLETGLRDLDELLLGLHPGQVVLVAARPAMGKTTLVTELAARIAARLAARAAGAAVRRRVLFLSLEMPRIELADRLLARASGIDLGRIRAARLAPEDLAALTAAAGAVDALPIDIDDAGDVTLLGIRARAREWKLRHGLALLVLDYVQLVKPGPNAPDTRDRQIGEVTEGLKALAKELEIPILVVSQLNREVEKRPNKRPMLSDLRESGSLEQDADVVLFLYRDEVYNRNSPDRGIAEVICAKQRNGPTDAIRLRFEKHLSRFDDVAEDERAQPALPLGGGRQGFTPEPEEYGPEPDPAPDPYV
jgi:replicative DNA helicase